MANVREPILCPECDREKYFEGLCYHCKNRKERERYQAMNPEGIENTIADIIERIATIDQWGEVYNNFRGLLAYHDINTEKIADAAFRKGIFYPPALYRNASDSMQDKLIAMVSDPSCGNANHVLACLAACGTDKVKTFFLWLEKNPLPWRKKLYVDPSVYAACGGWTFDKDGSRVELIYPVCYPLEKREEPDGPVRVGIPGTDQCTVCGSRLVNILTIDGQDERVDFLGLNGTIDIPLCPSCASMCEKTIVRYRPDGESTIEIIEPFGSENYVSEKELEKLAANTLSLAHAPQPVYYACGGDEVCTIGGHAEWIQDWQYEDCPDCGKKMKLLSALPWSELWDNCEGSLYIEICTDCEVVAAFHQQT